MSLFPKTGCGLKDSSLTTRMEKGAKMIKGGLKGKERGYLNWNVLLTSQKESI